MTTHFDRFLESKKKKEHETLDEQNMWAALHAAEKARSEGDIAIGATLVWPKKTLTECYSVVREYNALAHAEMNVLNKASEMMVRRIDDGILYSTLEPCSMCFMAAYWNGIKEVVFGAYDFDYGFASSRRGIADLDSLGITWRGGVLAKECYDILPKKIKERANTTPRSEMEDE